MAQAKKMLSRLKRYQEGGEVTDEFPEEAGVMPDQNPSEAAKRLLYYKKTAAPRLPEGGASTSQNIKNALVPVNMRKYISHLLGDRSPITESDFTEKDLDAIRYAIEKQGGGSSGTIGYGDYSPRGSSNFGNPGEGPLDLLKNSYTDPAYRMETTLGMASYRQLPDGSYVVEDRYNFNAPSREYVNDVLKKQNIVSIMAEVYKDSGLSGILNVLGNAYGDTESEPGTPVSIRLPRKAKKYQEGGEVEMPEEQASPVTEAAKRLLFYKKTAAPRLPPGVIPDTGQPDGMYQEPTVTSETARVFGMQPRQDRYNILPRYVPGEGIVAPEMLYDAARAVASSNVARQGYEVAPEDAINTAFNVAGGGFGVSTAMKKPTGGGAGKDLAMFVGQKSDTWDMDKFESALDFEKAGINPAEINRLTGYWKNPSSKIWSQEISDHTASLILGGLPNTLKDSAPITDVLSHTPLFKAYPDLKNIIIKREPGEGAKFDPEINTVFIGDKVTDPKKQLSYMIHELQHWVQAKENFPRGTSLEEIAKIETPEMAKINERLGQLFYAGKRDPKNEKEFKELMSRLKDLKRIQKDNSYALYAREEGEAQARATQARMWMDEQNRRSLTPLGDFDVPVSELIQMGEYGKLSPTSRVPGAPADIKPPVRMALPSSTTAKEDLAKVEAPSIMTRSGLTELSDYIKNREGGYGLRRVERAADEIPNLEKLYALDALRSAFSGDNARGLMTMKPADFEKYAAPLLTNLSQQSKDNIANLKTIQGAGGFSDVPFFLVNKELAGSTGVPFVTGHEGRHRSRAMDAAGVQSGLVQFLPRAELREPFPRKSQEQYIDAIRKEMALSGNKIKPEKYYLNETDEKSFQRPAIDLPDIYAKGGEVRKPK